MNEKEVLFKKEVTKDDIKNIIKEQLSVSDIEDSDRLIDDLFADSLDVVEILMNLEDTYGIEISENELDGNCKVQDVVQLVLNKIND